MPVLIDTVIVFGDSLSDIGRKWTTKAGKAALKMGEMTVNPTGRFSDCRNWTDYMIEAATGQSLVVGSAASSVTLSQMYLSLTAASNFGGTTHDFQYANYAEGGACGDTPHARGKRPFLSTFKEEVDWFEADLLKHQVALGNTLFIIWFGANDLYTAERPAGEMPLVAREVAVTQRNRLAQIVTQNGGTSRFIFVDLARPLTSVRYTSQLAVAERAAMTELNLARATGSTGSTGNLWYARQALASAQTMGAEPGRFTAKGRAVKNLQEKVEQIKGFEKGVLNYNVALAHITRQNRDRLAEIGSFLSEDSIARLVTGGYGLSAGALAAPSTHLSSVTYPVGPVPVTTIDEVHPTDRMYKLIWDEIYEEIKRADCTFGNLAGGHAATTLAAVSGPTATTRTGYNAVMLQLLATRARVD